MDTSIGTMDRSTDSNLIAASRVRGTAVYDASGEKIGTVDDIMIGKLDGQVAYAVMSVGGFLGIGERYHPLPWDALDYDSSVGGYRVGTAGENFRDAPSYDRSAIDSDEWSDETDRYYSDGATGGWITRRGQHDQPGGWRQEADRGSQSGTSFDPDEPGMGDSTTWGQRGSMMPGIGGGAVTGGVPLGGSSDEGPTRDNMDDDRTAPYGDPARSPVNS